MTEAGIQYKQLLDEITELRNRNTLLQSKNAALQKQNADLLTDLADTASELNLSNDQFRLMADSLPVIVWTADADGTVDYLTSAGTTLPVSIKTCLMAGAGCRYCTPTIKTAL